MFWNRPEKNSFRHFKLKMGRNTVKRSFAVCLARYWFSYSVCASGQELASPCSCEKGISHTEGRSWYWSSYIRLGKPQTIYERPSSRRRSCCHKRTARKVETAAAVMRSQTPTSLQRRIKYEHENLLPRHMGLSTNCCYPTAEIYLSNTKIVWTENISRGGGW